MPPLSIQPRIKLSRLRDIGWTHWDPIGLLVEGKHWDHEDAKPFADEYDSYLIAAAGMIRRGAPDQEVVAFLLQIETDHMALTEQPDSLDRAKATVVAIKADDELWTYPE